MDAIVGGRGEGKTAKLISWAAADHRRVIVVVDEPRAIQIKEMLRDQLVAMALDAEDIVTQRVANQVATTSRILRGLQRRSLQVAVDDLDAVLESIFRVKVDLVTFTGDAEQVGRRKRDAAAEELLRMINS